jgi:hypothetical protein
MTKVVVRASTQVSDRADVSDWAFNRKRVTHETDSIPLINGNSNIPTEYSELSVSADGPR